MQYKISLNVKHHSFKKSRRHFRIVGVFAAVYARIVCGSRGITGGVSIMAHIRTNDAKKKKKSFFFFAGLVCAVRWRHGATMNHDMASRPFSLVPHIFVS